MILINVAGIKGLTCGLDLLAQGPLGPKASGSKFYNGDQYNINDTMESLSIVFNHLYI